MPCRPRRRGHRQDGSILADLIPVRYRQDFEKVPPEQVDYVQLLTGSVISVATSLIPFLEHDDANRALMGSNMQRQAVPLLRPERPLVGTGLETQVARDSGMVPITRVNGDRHFCRCHGDRGSG